MIEAIIRRAATVLLMVLCVVVFGIWQYVQLPREAAPEVDIPVIMVSTPYPGVSPEDIESLLTTPLENELSGVADLKKLSSVSAEGVSLVTMEFEPEVVIEEALQRVRDRVSNAERKLPPEAEDTTVTEVSFSDFPILIVTIAGGVDEQQLKKLGEDLQEEIKRVPGVLDAKLSGGRKRQIRVQIDPIRLEHYGLSMNDAIGAIQNENVNIPGGNISVGDASVLLRVPGEFTDPIELENVAIKRKGDRPVFIRDVARIVDGFEDRSTYARMNGTPAVSLAVTKRTGSNILELSEAVKALVAERSVAWPEGVRYRVLGDQSKMIRDMVSDLENGILTALILVVGVIMFFMGVRNSLFVAIAIPLSFMLGMIVISVLGMTLNMIVLFSLILALGMLVDNAIVLVENIYRHLEMGASRREAAIKGAKEVAMAVAASTATTVAVFLPLLFWSGIMGQFMGYMPKTVVIILIASLVVAVGVLPVATAAWMKPSKATTRGDTERPPNVVMRAYMALLGASIRHRWLAAALMLFVLIGSFAAYGKLNHGTEFFSETQPNRATITVRAPDGTDIAATDEIVRKVEGILSEFENVDVFVAEVGVSGDAQDPMSANQAAANSARVTIDFLPDLVSASPEDKVRVEDTSVTVDQIRQRIEVIPGAEIAIEKERMGPPVGKPIAVEVSGEDFHAVGTYAAEVRRQLKTVEGTAALADDYRVGRPELRVRIDRGAAKRVGASTRAVAGALRTAVAGTKASTLRDGDDEYDIVIELDQDSRDDLQRIMAMRIPGREDTSPDTFAVPLATVAKYELAGGSGSIRHIDQDLVVTISGEIAEGQNENEVRQRVIDWIDQADVPAGFGVRLGGANDEQKEAQEFLGRAFVIGVFLISIVLVSQFNRFDLPLIILASVILSLVGVLWGLILTGTPFGVMMTGLGVISLAGVVVNNAIVLLDYIEQLRERGRTMFESLVEAGVARFRPVVLTAVTTILGLVPMALGISVDFANFRIVEGSSSSQWWGPMAVAVIFGLAFATVLTLVMVPTFYSIMEDIRGLRARVTAFFGGRSSAPAPSSAMDVDLAAEPAE
jgi:multidrug efflux pump subunit AcrB